jgi:hypothetical protein
MTSTPLLPPLNLLTERSLDDFRDKVLTLRNEIIRLRHIAHNTSGEMKEHYKYVIADHTWKLSQVIGNFWRESAHEITALELPSDPTLPATG